MLEISQNAAKHLAELLAERRGDGLRLAVKTGGCAGLQYILLVDFQHENDSVFECAGGRVLIDQESLSYLNGSTLDYDDALNGGGFRIQNPSAARSCGCGTSFELNPQIRSSPSM